MNLEGELAKTSHMLVNIAEEQGIYFAVAFLYDGGYDIARMKALLPILEKEQGAIKKMKKLAYE